MKNQIPPVEFNAIFKNIELDSSIARLQNVIDVLWASEESILEDDLVQICVIPSDEWQKIRNSFGESVLLDGGRVVFINSETRKAVESKYIATPDDRYKVYKRLASHCAERMGQGRKNLPEHVRRHAVRYFLSSGEWDAAVAALTDLDFIEERTRAQEASALLLDYAHALRVLPGQSGRAVARPEELDAERRRIIEHPEARDLVQAFQHFLACNAGAIENNLDQPGFLAELACTACLPGPVYEAGLSKMLKSNTPLLQRRPGPYESYNPLPVCKGVRAFRTSSFGSAGYHISLSEDLRTVVSAGDALLRIWDAESAACLNVLNAQEDGILAIAMSLDTSRLVSAGEDHSIIIWDMKTGERLHILTGHQDSVYQVTISGNGRRIVSSSSDLTLRVWDMETGACLQVIEDEYARKVQEIKRLLDPIKKKLWREDDASAEGSELSRDAKAELSKMREDLDQQVQEIWAENKFHRLLVVNHDGSKVYTQHESSTLSIWDIDSGTCLSEQIDSRLLKISSDFRLAITHRNGALAVWDVVAKKTLHPLQGYTGEVECLEVTRDGRRVVVACGDKKIRMWDIQTGECLREIDGPGYEIDRLPLSEDGRILIVGAYSLSSMLLKGENFFSVWNMETGECLGECRGHDQDLAEVVISPDGRMAFSICHEPELRIWDLTRLTGACLPDSQKLSKIDCMAMSADGARVATGSKDHSVKLWDAATGECLRVLKGHESPVTDIAISNDGKKIVSGSKDKHVLVWDVSSSECLRKIEVKGGYYELSVLAISADSRRIYASAGSELGVWDIETGELLNVAAKHEGLVFTIYECLDGLSIVSGSSYIGEKGCRLWDSATGDCLRLFEEPFCGEAVDVTLSADGRRLVVGNDDETSIFDFKTGAVLKTIEKHAGHAPLIKLEPAPDGRRFVSMHHKALCLWNMNTGKLEKTFPSDTWRYSSIAISPDGLLILCRGRNNKLTIIDIKTGKIHAFHLHGISTSVIDWARRRVSVGFSDGRVEFYDLQGIELKPFITTAVREIVPSDVTSSPVKARPVCCKQEIAIPKQVTERIRHWTEKEGSGGYKDPALVLNCPHCATPLRMNPFFVDVTAAV